MDSLSRYRAIGMFLVLFLSDPSIVLLCIFGFDPRLNFTFCTTLATFLSPSPIIFEKGKKKK